MTAIAFTYDVGTPIGQVRFYAGDTDGTGLNRAGGDRTRTDAEVQFLLEQSDGDVRVAAGELLEGRAAEYAQAATSVTQGSMHEDLTQRARWCLAAAAVLRASSGRPLLQFTRSAVFSSETADGIPGTMDVW